MSYSAVDVLHAHDFLDNICVPRRGLSWVFMQKVSAVLNMVSIELAAETEMSEACGIFTGDNLGVPLGVADVLPCRECRAHGRANQ